VVRAVHRILAELQFETLQSVGIEEQHLDALAENALTDYFITLAPESWSKDEAVAAYRAGLALGATR